MRILIVEDDHVLGGALVAHLAHQGHAADWVQRLDDAQEALATTRYDLILLDLGLPDGRGIDFLAALRAQGDATPVIIATAQDQVQIRIEGLNTGADDYIVKPFDLEELSARLSAVSRRYAASGDTSIQFGAVCLDLDRRQASLNDKPVILTAREWAVLDALVRNRGAVVSKASLEDKLYAFGSEIESNAVEVFVSRLRKKLGRELIQTQRGLGYVLGGQG